MCRYLWVYRGKNGYVWVCKSRQVENWKIVTVKKWKSGNLEK